MSLKNFCVLLIVFMLPVNVYSEEKEVTLATLTDFAPYCFRKDNSIQLHEEIIPPGENSSQLQGYSWDIVRQSFHEVGYTIRLFVVPWERVMHYLESGKVEAIFPANRTKKRELHYSFSKEYVDRTKMVVYVPENSKIEWAGLDSLNGLSVGAVRGWAYGKKWENNKLIKKEFMDTILQSFDVMDKKRLAAVVGFEIAYDYVLRSAGKSEQYKKIGFFDIIDEYLIGKIDSSVAKQKISDFDKGHALLEKRGGLHKIIIKWQ